MKRIVLALVLAVSMTGCAAATTSKTPQHNLRLINADLASALNTVESTALTLNTQGIISTAETVSVSNVILNATVASDGIEKCADNTTGTISGCIAPFIQSIKSNMTISALGIKSQGAISNFNTVINAVIATLNNLASSEASF
jgi:hypothetical protein